MGDCRALAIETSGRIGEIGLVENGQTVLTRMFPHGLHHAAAIVSTIDQLTRSLGWRPREIQQVYVSAGPGSFTGLRIGITLVKTLAFSINCKIVAVESCKVLLMNAPSDAREVIIVLDAKRGQIFGARFLRQTSSSSSEPLTSWTEVEPPHLDTLSDILQRSGRPVTLIGEGIPYHQHLIRDPDSVRVTEPSLWRARVEHVARLGWHDALAGRFADPFTLTPIYVRLPEAEEKRLSAEGKLAQTSLESSGSILHDAHSR